MIALSMSLRIVKLDQHGRFVHSAESQTALAGYVALACSSGPNNLVGETTVLQLARTL